MMNKRVLLGILVLGSCWGLLEAVMGSVFKAAQLPYGVLMTTLFALPILVISKMMFSHRGAQTGVGMVAGSLAFFNPWIGCSVCSAIAIAAEAIIFEIIWLRIKENDFGSLTLIQKASLGVITAYGVYVSGYMITQILTPALYGSFLFTNFIVVVPQILAQGLPASLLGFLTVPLVMSTYKLNITIQDKLYYPTGATITVLCWLFIVGNWLIFIT